MLFAHCRRLNPNPSLVSARTRGVLSSGFRREMKMRFLKPCVYAASLSSITRSTGFTFDQTLTTAAHHRRTSFAYSQTCLFSSSSSGTDAVSAETPASSDSDATASSDTPASYATTYHAPVMWRECIDALLSCQRSENRREGEGDSGDDDGKPLVFVDGTLGGGGHSAALLKEMQPGDVLFGCDVDPTALQTASDRLSMYLGQDDQLPLFVPVCSNFADLATALPEVRHPKTDELMVSHGTVDGILMDLGVSSYQIDTAERGFAFMKEGPLDMRMGQDARGGMTAADICNEFDVKEIQRILKVYGDEPRAKVISQSIIERRPLLLTSDLVSAVSAVTPQFAKKGRRLGRTATLARVFQSLRIVVNREDAVLEKALEDMCPTLLRPGGILAVLSYHSLEDRCAKRVMRDGTVKKDKRNDERDMYGNYSGTPRPFRTLGKSVKASDEEIETNPRARSATLRIAEREDTN
jgi:16S rRNA (cytosine1402-N4)-methyltransferase